jgi:hypothetical protein
MDPRRPRLCPDAGFQSLQPHSPSRHDLLNSSPRTTIGGKAGPLTKTPPATAGFWFDSGSSSSAAGARVACRSKIKGAVSSPEQALDPHRAWWRPRGSGGPRRRWRTRPPPSEPGGVRWNRDPALSMIYKRHRGRTMPGAAALLTTDVVPTIVCPLRADVRPLGPVP